MTWFNNFYDVIVLDHATPRAAFFAGMRWSATVLSGGMIAGCFYPFV